MALYLLMGGVMDFYHIRNAKTCKEFIDLLYQANIPHDVRLHVEQLIDNHAFEMLDDVDGV